MGSLLPTETGLARASRQHRPADPTPPAPSSCQGSRSDPGGSEAALLRPQWQLRRCERRPHGGLQGTAGGGLGCGASPRARRADRRRTSWAAEAGAAATPPRKTNVAAATPPTTPTRRQLASARICRIGPCTGRTLLSIVLTWTAPIASDPKSYHRAQINSSRASQHIDSTARVPRAARIGFSISAILRGGVCRKSLEPAAGRTSTTVPM